ncbi:MAG: sigma-70 RNA polymerase sigma factor region 4 domain-containing protein, partial [Planctomycetota bacterium]
MTQKQKEHDLKTSDWHDAYVSFRPLLFSALGRLARQGYHTEPSEAPEIIHDFISEAWPGIEERFDPARAKFRTYLYGAFLRFARVRIVQKQKWRASLVSPEEMALIKGDESDDTEMRFYLAEVRQVLNQLPDETRRILQTLTAAGYRERRAAARMGVSRHRFRCLASEALAQFAIKMDISELVPENDWPLARALWAEGRSLEDAAAAIGISVLRARIVRRRILRTMEDTLSEFSPFKVSRKKEGTMKLCDLWQQFVVNPTDRQLLTQVHERADELFEHLLECEECDSRSEALQSNLATFYEALGATIEMTPAEESALEEYERATAENNARVRDAIESVLLPALPPPLVDRLLSRMRPEALVNMFLACETLAMRIHRHARHEEVSNFVLRSNGLHFVRAD